MRDQLVSPRAAYKRELRATRRRLGKCRYCHRPSNPFTRCAMHRRWFQEYRRRRNASAR
jgi:hypothetical protein